MSFAPVAGESARALILGTWPSPESWRTGFYYGHPRNRFWPLLAHLTGRETPRTVEEKKALIVESGLALWDTLESCTITGASDASIRDAAPHDVAGLCKQLGVQAVFCNGAAAHRFYVKFHQPLTGIEAVQLPSTSPANAAWSFEKLCSAWAEVGDWARGLPLHTQALRGIGIHQHGIVRPAEIPFDESVRRICEGNVCRLYGKSWACPPAVGTVEQCRARCLAYAHAMVFSAVYPLDDPFDYEGMQAGHRAFKELCDRLYVLAKPAVPAFLLLSNEGCLRCKPCTFPHAACRMPETLFPSLEGFGIQVSELAARAGIAYTNGPGTVTYFGMLLY